ncbi:hypothetical protein HN51_006914 [Arachis hypogaea]|uniref:Lipid phosphate phosphatase epsilon 1, chloroplastic n=1 Tax=Arachis duranensis TaxID=130453 RepID=A0A6P4DCR1_ARADU|nr:lipid phosphate phosphatase epsilon 1, chloroplastic [Arachis duranensis]XP_025698913.1 lipid phosphate phosphatase epsilon 1, chloroplastic isoform X1 [Arachis hypogaea]
MALLPTTTALSHLPRTTLLRHTHPFKKNTSFALTFSASRSVLFGGAVTRTHFLGGNKIWVSSNTMNEFTQPSAFRDRERDDIKQVFEQEAFIDGSTEFQPNILFRDIEPRLNRLSKWIVAVSFGGFILWSHDIEEALWIFAGSILNSFLSVLLKNILNQERPSALKSDPGMPSTHAQSIFFVVFFFIFSTIELLGLNVYSIVLSGLYLTCGSYFSYLRVSQQLHTMNQVVVGATIGSIMSLVWYWLWNAFIQDAYQSSLFVRIIGLSGSIGICICFLVFVIRHWLKDD